jgi:hypothetical protein
MELLEISTKPLTAKEALVWSAGSRIYIRGTLHAIYFHDVIDNLWAYLRIQIRCGLTNTVVRIDNLSIEMINDVKKILNDAGFDTPTVRCMGLYISWEQPIESPIKQ